MFATDPSCQQWSGQRDLNPRPSAPKADALPDCAIPRFFPKHSIIRTRYAGVKTKLWPVCPASIRTASKSVNLNGNPPFSATAVHAERSRTAAASCPSYRPGHKMMKKNGCNRIFDMQKRVRRTEIPPLPFAIRHRQVQNQPLNPTKVLAGQGRRDSVTGNSGNTYDRSNRHENRTMADDDQQQHHRRDKPCPRGNKQHQPACQRRRCCIAPLPVTNYRFFTL